MSTLHADRFNGYPTPFFYYDMERLRRTLQSAGTAAAKHDFKLHYALKANANPRVLDAVRAAGFGADCVSGNEVKAALAAGFEPRHVVLAGVGKRDDEIQLALDQNIFSLNCESVEELEVIDRLAAGSGVTANVALRLNPNLDANTHRYITTGLEENKFGIGLWQLDDALNQATMCTSVNLTGLHFHIGSQITDLAVFKSLCIKVNEVLRRVREKGIALQHLNLGGGLGVDYHQPDADPDFESYFALFRRFIETEPRVEIHFEPGRALVAQSGTLVSRVLYVKQGAAHRFAIVDAGMTELLRPALYQSYHAIENLTNPSGTLSPYDVVGPVCESSDCFGRAVMLPEVKRGHLLVVRSAGAYGESMALRYNLRDVAPAFFSDALA
ncbi:MAG TPA: diaminopimelate decarboxylase [Chitinophagales bacterium]|nr:diaminopimelate decarboxylase [Chitinophagales bacterium]